MVPFDMRLSENVLPGDNWTFARLGGRFQYGFPRMVCRIGSRKIDATVEKGRTRHGRVCLGSRKMPIPHVVSVQSSHRATLPLVLTMSGSREDTIVLATIDEEHVEVTEEKRRLGDRVIPLPLIFSVTAVVVSLVSLYWTVYRSPTRPQLSKYDFSTPKDSLFSLSRMELSGDIGSQIALRRLFSARTIEEKLKTLTVHKEAEWAGNRILFVSFEENGLVKHTTDAYTKDAETGFWKPDFVSSYDVGKTDEKLAALMQEWTTDDNSVFANIAKQLSSPDE